MFTNKQRCKHRLLEETWPQCIANDSNVCLFLELGREVTTKQTWLYGKSRELSPETGSDLLPLLQRSRDHVYITWHVVSSDHHKLSSPLRVFIVCQHFFTRDICFSFFMCVSRVRSPPPLTQWLSGGSSAVFTLLLDLDFIQELRRTKTNWVWSSREDPETWGAQSEAALETFF